MKLDANEALQTLLEPYPFDAVWQVMTVRSLILNCDKRLTEKVHQGWQIIKLGDTIYIAPKLAGVFVGFLKGVHLPDPAGLLVGKAKEARSYWWGREEDLKQDDLANLVLASLAFEG